LKVRKTSSLEFDAVILNIQNNIQMRKYVLVNTSRQCKTNLRFKYIRT